ncbi:colanic acid biosynthesis glycosyltransferase WcaI [Leucothrix sargassi]|nr:colanic acid biosynthesis glycosyltransferase WcaI [Leucothrix sargassi]
MKILIYGLNYSPELTGIGKYTGEMATWLAAKGHDVRVITAPPYYPQWKIGEGHRNSYQKHVTDGVTVYRCPLYVPKGKISTVKRLVHLTSFSVTSFFTLGRNLMWSPDVVVNVVPALFTTPGAMLYSKIVRAKLITHIQDFESDAMFGLGMAKKGVIAKGWGMAERFMFKYSSSVSSISRAMINNAVSKGARPRRTYLLPNWSELAMFKNVEDVEQLRASLGLPLDKSIILYSGNLGRKQGLERVVDVAWQKREQSDLHFVICGDGAAKQDLEAMAEMLKLTNLSFLPLQAYEDLPKLLTLADVHLVVQNAGVADAVLPSKLTNILAVGGNAVITATEDTEMGLLVSKYPEIATLVEPENDEALSKGIDLALQKKALNTVAIQYADNFLDKESILSDFEKMLNRITSEDEHGIRVSLKKVFSK